MAREAVRVLIVITDGQEQALMTFGMEKVDLTGVITGSN